MLEKKLAPSDKSRHIISNLNRNMPLFCYKKEQRNVLKNYNITRVRDRILSLLLVYISVNCNLFVQVRVIFFIVTFIVVERCGPLGSCKSSIKKVIVIPLNYALSLNSLNFNINCSAILTVCF